LNSDDLKGHMSMSKETTVTEIASGAPQLAEQMKRSADMEAFSAWTTESGFRGVNPESLEWAISHPSSLTESEARGLRYFLEDFRALFGVRS
jgi:hypothetical protein